jgi:hypothetical protein
MSRTSGNIRWRGNGSARRRGRCGTRGGGGRRRRFRGARREEEEEQLGLDEEERLERQEARGWREAANQRRW